MVLLRQNLSSSLTLHRPQEHRLRPLVRFMAFVGKRITHAFASIVLGASLPDDSDYFKPTSADLKAAQNSLANNARSLQDTPLLTAKLREEKVEERRKQFPTVNFNRRHMNEINNSELNHPFSRRRFESSSRIGRCWRNGFHRPIIFVRSTALFDFA